MNRDTVAILFWALRWHEGRRVANRVLHEVLWGEFTLKPKDPDGTLCEFMTHVHERYGDQWIIENCESRAFRILPGAAPNSVTKGRRTVQRDQDSAHESDERHEQRGQLRLR